MAAELAPGLAAGCSCPVCGSCRAPLPCGRLGQGEPRRRGRRARAARDRGLRAAGSPGVGDGAGDPARGCASTSAPGPRGRPLAADARRSASTALEQSARRRGDWRSFEAEVTSLTTREKRLATALASSQADLGDADPAARGVRGQVLTCSPPSCASCWRTTPRPAPSPPWSSCTRRRCRVLEAAREALARHERAAHELSQATAAAEARCHDSGFRLAHHRTRCGARRWRGGCPVHPAR